MRAALAGADPVVATCVRSAAPYRTSTAALPICGSRASTKQVTNQATFMPAPA
jgi:hypothetical protein